MFADAWTSLARNLLRLAAVLGLATAAGAFSVARGPAAPPAATGSAPRRDGEGFPLPAEALTRVGSARLRHGRGVTHLEYSPDGTLLASSEAGSLQIWDSRIGKLLKKVHKADGREVPDGFFSTDGKTIVAVDGLNCHWFDVRTGLATRHYDITSPPEETDAYISPRGELLAVVNYAMGDDLVVYELQSGRERFRKSSEGLWVGSGMCGGGRRTSTAAFSPGGNTLAVMEMHGQDQMQFRVCVFETATGKTLGRFDVGELRNNLTFSPDGKKLLADDGDKNITVWSVPAGKILNRLVTGSDGLMMAAFTPDGKSVVFGSASADTVRIDLATEKEVARFRTSAFPRSFAFTPDGKTLAVGTANGTITQWDLATGKRQTASAEPVNGFWQPRFDGKLLWVCSNELVAVDWESGRVMRRVSLPHHGGGAELTVSPDRSRAAGVNADHRTAVWDLASGKELCSLPTRTIPVVMEGIPLEGVVFSPEGKTLYTARQAESVRGWDVANAREMPAFDTGVSGAPRLAISPNGRRLALADQMRGDDGRPQVIIWDLAGKDKSRQLSLPEGSQPRGLTFSPDGNLLAVVGGETLPWADEMSGFVTLWDVRTGEKKPIGTGASVELGTVAFSADGRSLVTGDDSGAVRVWEVATGRERHHFAGHVSSVNEVAFSPDGKLLASTSSDAPVFIWDVEGCHGKPPSAEPFTAEERANLWDALNDVNASVAFDAMRHLLARPKPAVALLRERLPPAAAVDEKTVQPRLRDLDANAFPVREKVTAELEAIADRATSLLRKSLAGAPSAETKRRIERILEAVDCAGSERRREMRAVEVLDRLATAEARQLLGTLARGTDAAFLTREARAALEPRKVR
jgi:WD40 repeat protein